MSAYLFKPEQRYAVWKSGGGRCYLCKRPIAYQDTTVDHVLPERLLNSREEFETAIRQLSLPADFNINSFVNWAPACDACNRSKSGEVFEPSLIVAVQLQRLRKSAARVEAHAEHIAQNASAGKILAHFEVLIERERDLANEFLAHLVAVAAEARPAEELDRERLRLLGDRLRNDALVDQIEMFHAADAKDHDDEDLRTIHEQVEAYVATRAQYDTLADLVATTLREELRVRNISVASVVLRTKDPNAVRAKLRRVGGQARPLTDLAGIRVCCHFLNDLDSIEAVVRDVFAVEGSARRDGRWVGLRFVLHLREVPRGAHKSLLDLPCEVHVRTQLQDAWSELSHELAFGAAAVVDAEPLRAVAKIIEAADVVLQLWRERRQ